MASSGSDPSSSSDSNSSSWLPFSYDQIFLALSPSHALYHWFSKTEGDEGCTERPKTPEAPKVASDAFGISLISQIRAFVWNTEMVQKGYDENKNGVFRMPMQGEWITVATGQYIDEIAHAPDSVLSFQAVLNQQLELDHLAGPAVTQDQIHLNVIKMLTRNLRAVYFEILDETKYAFTKQIDEQKADDEGWIKIKALDTLGHVVSQLNHRAFVGLPLCREEEWIKLEQSFTTDFVTRAMLLKVFPKSQRGNVNYYLSKVGSTLSQGVKMLSVVINERKEMRPDERPNDMITWIMSIVDTDAETALRTIITTFHILNSVAEVTSQATFVHALFHLAASPEYIEELREEAIEVITVSDWTKESIDRMRKLDSFVRETQRLSGIQNASMLRLALQDFTFSNGVRVRKGETVAAVGNALHHDTDIYDDALEFKPFRFYELGEADRAAHTSHKYDMITPSHDYLAWGLGKHACPGRWYASMIVKHLLAYVLIFYEFKFTDATATAAMKANANMPAGKAGTTKTRPKDLELGGGCLPNTKAEMLFRRRKDEDVAFLSTD